MTPFHIRVFQKMVERRVYSGAQERAHSDGVDIGRPVDEDKTCINHQCDGVFAMPAASLGFHDARKSLY